MKMLIILNFILLLAILIIVLIFSLYVKQQKEEEMQNKMIIENMKANYEKEIAKLEEQKKNITGNNDASDAILSNMLQDAAKKSKTNSRRN